MDKTQELIVRFENYVDYMEREAKYLRKALDEIKNEKRMKVCPVCGDNLVEKRFDRCFDCAAATKYIKRGRK